MMSFIAKSTSTQLIHPMIAFCIGSFQAGGSERHVLRLIKNLPSYGFQVSLVVNSLSGPLLKEIRNLGNPITEISLSPSITGRLKFIIQMAKYLHENKINVVQAFNDSLIFYVALAAKIAHTPGVFFGLRNTRFFDRHISYRKMVGWACKYWTKGVITNSNATAVLVAEQFSMPQERIWVAHNGIPTYPNPQGDSYSLMRKSLGIPAAVLTIGIVARLDPVKRIDTLIQAAALLPDLPLHYLIVGDGNESTHLKELVNAVGLADRFTFAGYQSDVTPWIHSLDIGVLCSGSEGFPQAILEYMACGLPVIAPCIGGIPEIVVDGVTGLLVLPKDPVALSTAIRRLTKNNDLRIRMGKAGQERAREQFSLENEIKATINAYNHRFKEDKSVESFSIRC